MEQRQNLPRGSGGPYPRGVDFPRRPYCLNCYAALAPFEGSRHVCSSCGFLNLRVDQELYWTREKRFRDLEELAKTMIVFFLGGVSLLMFSGLGSSGIGMGQGWAVGFPILFGALLWETASKITRWKPYLRAGLVWGIMSGVVAAPFLMIGFGADIRVSERAVFLGVGFVLGLIAVGLPRVSRGLHAWRLKRICAAQDPRLR